MAEGEEVRSMAGNSSLSSSAGEMEGEGLV